MASAGPAPGVAESSVERARPLRADAQRNRDKLLAAATHAFAAHGEDVALEAVAARAGVGIGTLYRHFPSRDALVIAAYRHEVARLCAAASELLAAQPPDAALRAWAERFTDYIATKRAMGSALRSAAGSDAPLFAETRALILGALRLLLDAGARRDGFEGDVLAVRGERVRRRGQQLLPVALRVGPQRARLLDAGARAGTLRAAAAPADVLRVLNGIWFLPDGPEWRETVGRMLDLVIDGLRYGATGSARRERPQSAP